MLRPLRTAISVAILAGLLWAAFAVDLGDKSFAEHVDTISETPEAKQLVDDTRSTINPALMEVRDRVLGEYVEAPTWIPDPEQSAAAQPAGEAAGRPEPDAEPPLPGRRGSELRPPPIEEDFEPALPGRR